MKRILVRTGLAKAHLLEYARNMGRVNYSWLLVGGAFAIFAAAASLASLSQPPVDTLNTSHFPYWISEVGTTWKETPPPPEFSGISRLFRAPLRTDGSQGTFTIRLDASSSDFGGMDSYTRKWLKEFPRFGYEVLAAREFEQGTEKGFVFDLVHKELKKQVRQVIFFRKSGAAVMTCTDKLDHFIETGAACDRLIKTFRWN